MSYLVPFAPLDVEIDEMAERLAMLGGVPGGRVSTVANDSSLEVNPLESTSGSAHLTALADRFVALGNSVRASFDAVNAPGVAETTRQVITVKATFVRCIE